MRIYLEPVEHRLGTATTDLIRGDTVAELDYARAIVPEKLEPPVGTPVPREVRVEGRVFLDRNGNGKLDEGEPGLHNVLITDGSSIHRTDNDGNFTLSFLVELENHCRFVVVTRPTGYRPTTFFFLRIPFDEEMTEYFVNFGFCEDEASHRSEFSFLVASDSQFRHPEAMIAIAKDFAQMTESSDDLAFLVTIGDLTMSGTHYQWDMYDQIQKASRLFVYNGFGGHDGNCPKERSTLNYECRIGPPYYSWDYGGVHFIQFVTEGGYLSEAARARQQTWLEADLKAIKPYTPVIVVTHYPLIHYRTLFEHECHKYRNDRDSVMLITIYHFLLTDF